MAESADADGPLQTDVSWEDRSWWNGALHRNSVLDYFSHSQFYDRTCLNEQLKMQVGLPPEQQRALMRRMPGIEYRLEEERASEVPPSYRVISPRPLATHRGSALGSGSGEPAQLAPGTRLHVLEAIANADGTQRVKFRLAGAPAAGGWLTALNRDKTPNISEPEESHASYVIRKLRRTEGSGGGLEEATLRYYYVLDGVVYEAPTLAAVVQARLLRLGFHLSKAFEAWEEVGRPADDEDGAAGAEEAEEEPGAPEVEEAGGGGLPRKRARKS